MKSQTESSQQRVICAVVIFFLISVTFFVVFNNAAEKVLHNMTQSTLNEIAIQQQLIINMDINDAKSEVILLAESFSTLTCDKNDIKNYLVNQANNSDFEELTYIELDGFRTSAYGRDSEIDLREHLKNPRRNFVSTSRPYLCTYTHNRVMDMASPIYNNTELIGFVIAKYSFSLLAHNLNNFINGNGYALVSEGFEIPAFTTSNDYQTLTQLKNATIKNGDSIENVMKNIKLRKDGSFSFESNLKKQIAIYKSLDISDWYLMMVIDEDKATASTKIIANIIALISIIVLGLLSFFLWYALHSKVENIKKIEQVAYYDELTGLPNLTRFKMYVSNIIQNHPTKEFAMIKIDIVNFKAINEMYNFDVGNQVLQAFAKTSLLAEEETFILARVTGDEFLMFSGNGFLENLDKMTYYYEEYFKNAIPGFDNYHFQFNYGRYFIKPGETDINDMINKTTMAHSIAKTKKEKTIWNYDDTYKEQILQIADITNKMRKALYNKEFVTFLQPKYNIKDKKVVGAEALVRWFDTEGNTMLPSIFIPLFEKNGFIVDLDMYVLQEVCKTIKNWMNDGYECVPVSVNISRVHLENKNFLEQIVKIVDKIGIPHHYIELELTESIVLENEEVLENLLSDFHKEGFLVSIDDFGSGYSSLGLLKNFKVNTIKLDRSFFNATKEKGRGELVVDGIVKLANSLNIHIVAEGIENEEQVALLQRVQCDTIQGFYFSKAIPVKDFTEKYIRT